MSIGLPNYSQEFRTGSNIKFVKISLGIIKTKTSVGIPIIFIEKLRRGFHNKITFGIFTVEFTPGSEDPRENLPWKIPIKGC